MKKSYRKIVLVLGSVVLTLVANAQTLTLSSPVVGYPQSGNSGANLVLGGSSSTSKNGFKGAGTVQGVTLDGQGNAAIIAYSANGAKNRLGRIVGGNVVIASTATDPNAVAIDNGSNFVYDICGVSTKVTGLFNCVGGTNTITSVGIIPLNQVAIGAEITASPKTATASIVNGVRRTYVVGAAMNFDSTVTYTLSKSLGGTAVVDSGSFTFSTPLISRQYWQSTTVSNSFGYYLNAAVGAKVSIANIPFVACGDSVLLDDTLRPLMFSEGLYAFKFDSQGNLYYADQNDCYLRRISFASADLTDSVAKGGTVITVDNVPAGVTIGTLVSGIYFPHGTYVRAINGNQITLSQAATAVTSIAEGSIQFITAVTTVAGNGVNSSTGDGGYAVNATLSQPFSIAFGSDGSLYLAEQGGNKEIRKITATGGAISSTAPISSFFVKKGTFKTVYGIDLDADNNVYIMDNGNSTIYTISQAAPTVVSKVLGAGSALTVDSSAGTIGTASFVVNFTQGTAKAATRYTNFKKIVPGMYLTGGGVNIGTKVVSTDSTSGTVYLSDTLTATQTNTTYTYISGDTSISTGTGYLSAPNSIAINKTTGSIWFVDLGGNTVRKADNAGVATPVKLAEFTAQASGSAVLLKWQTTNEINSDYFGLERSIDGVNWKELGIVKAAGKASSTNNYQYIDYKPATVNYYRLKQVDLDGAFTYSAVRQVNFEVEKTGLKTYPNPVVSSFSVDLGNGFSTPVHYSIISINGNLVKSGIISSRQQTIDLSNVAKGIYILKTDDGQSAKLIKQ